MTNNGQVALAFTSGYLFGRGHRMRSALALAGLTAGRRLVMSRGAVGPERLMSSELGKLSHDVRDQLMAAGRSAAMSAASHRIDALSDRLEQRATALRSGSDGHKGDEGREESKESKGAEESKEAKGAGGSKARGEERGGERESGREERSRGGERETRHKRTADRPERPGKKAGAEGSERRGRG
ncbi:hypothetical protein [Streptomyces sp. ME19-01-6]|uniref:hypothetical protein n=1 Tax=Streptomyces sp. ME19-01-6 TaxID=3028686 RepID=UPI0029B26A88|nr:hypothetical protein [Streptomyces sp. ME19-01-6]MDX3233104.1 hypothetical protein [Streptomyces sp. ME19-01-6]